MNREIDDEARPCPNFGIGEYEAALSLIASGKINVEAILSAEAPLTAGADWFRRLYNKEKGLIKVVLKP